MIHKAKKSLGQNFLKSESTLRKICDEGEINITDTILEIGPGKGALTKKLLERSKKVLAIEKDDNLFSFLQEKFSEEIKNKKLELINEDILNFDLIKKLKNQKYKLIANIPYNITGAILKKFLTEKNQPQKMVLLVQKEVAERIVSRNKKESILSLSIKSYGEPKYISKVSKKYFSPSPKVDSAIISISNISRKNFINNKQEKLFFDLIHNGFAHKRKILIKNLESLIKNRELLEKIFKNLEIDEKIRAEDINLEKWLEINRKLSTEI